MIEDLRVVDLDLALTRPFRIARGSTETVRELVLRVTDGDAVGYGAAHASPAVTGETHDEAREALESLAPGDLDPEDVPGTLERMEDAGPAARASVDLALHDLAGRREGRGAHELVGLPSGEAASAATVTVDDAEGVAEQARAWTKRGFATLKLKVDADADVLALVDAVQAAVPDTMRDPLPDPRLWVDANEALTLEGARAIVDGLAERGVVLLEQPLPRDEEAATLELAREAPLPVVVDEGVQGPGDVARLADAGAPVGVNVKVQKVGGLLAAARCVERAREADMPLVVGCNVESGLGIAAGACLCGAVDHVDLDGNLFLDRDPFPLPRPMPGHVATPSAPGLGVHPDPRFDALAR